jgi:two-component system, OmpR family, KDP operon response regulator KdpE
VKILVVDDDPQIREALSVGFELQWPDARVVASADGESGLRSFDYELPDVVILDLSLPDRDGLDVLREIRRTSDVAVIVLTARGNEAEQVRGLELGADDYVVKPFSHLALIARVRAVLRRTELRDPVRTAPDFVADDLTISFASRRVTVCGESVSLTPVEYGVLYQLVRNAGRLVTREALIRQVWSDGASTSPDQLRVFISRLRAKIESTGGPSLIESERGLGYRFVGRPEREGPAER